MGGPRGKSWRRARRRVPLRTRGSALATAVALPLTLNTSQALVATGAPVASVAVAAVAVSPVSLPWSPVTIGAEQHVGLPGASAPREEKKRTVEVSSPKGTRTWSASALTDHGLPAAARRAYVEAAGTMAAIDPACQLPWTLLAGVGRIESDHGRYGGSVLGQDGVSHPRIIGVALNGAGPVAAIRDTDAGRLDKDKVWDRAVGPMQFIPSTWAGAARDGDGDGVESPNDIDDAALAAAAYLCAGYGSILGESAMRAAIFRYNASKEYVALVMAMERGYRTGVFIMPSTVVADARPDRPKRKGRAGRDGPRRDDGGSGGQSSSTASGGKKSGGGSSSPSPSGGSSSSGGGSGGGGGGTSPSSTPTPTPTPEPKPTTEEKSGTLATCPAGWCLGGWALDLGGAAQLAEPADHDYDGDKVPGETNLQELEGLAGKDVTVVVKFGTAIVIEIQGLQYAP